MIEEPFDQVLIQICCRIYENFTKSKFFINTRTVILRNMLMSDQELPGKSAKVTSVRDVDGPKKLKKLNYN